MIKTEEINVANMKCASCAATIKNELIKLKGIESADADLQKNLVKVSYDEIKRAEIIGKLNALGYPEVVNH